MHQMDLNILNPLRVSTLTSNFNTDYNNQPRPNTQPQKTVPKELAAFTDALMAQAKPVKEMPKLRDYTPPKTAVLFEDDAVLRKSM